MNEQGAYAVALIYQQTSYYQTSTPAAWLYGEVCCRKAICHDFQQHFPRLRDLPLSSTFEEPGSRPAQQIGPILPRAICKLPIPFMAYFGFAFYRLRHGLHMI
jgi:hypothetical protein